MVQYKHIKTILKNKYLNVNKLNSQTHIYGSMSNHLSAVCHYRFTTKKIKGLTMQHTQNMNCETLVTKVTNPCALGPSNSNSTTIRQHMLVMFTDCWHKYGGMLYDL